MPPCLAPRFFPLRPLRIRVNSLVTSRRAFHDAKADFIFYGSRGSLTTRKLDIFIGDPHETYIIFDKDVGFALKSAIAKQAGVPLPSDLEKLPLSFFHDSLHFANDAAAYPRMVIQRDLPRQNKTGVSPATLWLWGASGSITLDNTPDHHFEESCRESHGRLAGALKLLRDR